MKKHITLLIAAALAATGLSAQTAAGRLIRMSDFSPSEMALFSQQYYSFGTARTAAMGGAFSSLGADLSSMSMNPAGLGMYRSSEFSFSPSVTWTDTKSKATASNYVTNDKTRYDRFALGNIGLAINTFQSTGTLTSFTFGFAYNKLADFNYRSNIGLDDQLNSIADVFARQLDGIPSSQLSYRATPSPWRNERIAPNRWGAVAGFQTWAVMDLPDDYYDANLWVEELPNGEWTGPLTNNFLRTKTTGGLGEYNISGGMNFGNVVYAGFSLGIQNLLYEQYNYYDEEYTLTDDPAYATTLAALEYDQWLKYSGTGVNVKLGVIVRPIEELRFGLAYHSPTWMSVDQEYQITHMNTIYQNGDYPLQEPVFSDVLVYTYKYNSPSRLMVGLSYQFEDVAIFTADYECVWYDKMRLRDANSGSVSSAYRDDIEYAFRPSNNVRVGLELKPVSALALRAGVALYDSPVVANKYDGPIDERKYVTPADNMPASVIDNPVATKVTNYSAGLGYRNRGFSLDLAYVFSDTEYSNYSLHSYWDENQDTGELTKLGSGPVKTSMKRNILTMTMGFRF